MTWLPRQPITISAVTPRPASTRAVAPPVASRKAIASYTDMLATALGTSIPDDRRSKTAIWGASIDSRPNYGEARPDRSTIRGHTPASRSRDSDWFGAFVQKRQILVVDV
jgi:hypothetical protein